MPEHPPEVHGMLLASILLMQVFGPFATQFAIREFGEAIPIQKPEKSRLGRSI